MEKDINKIIVERRNPLYNKTWITVLEMGNLLGIKKTERYYLLKKGLFESKTIAGQLRVNVDSFERWYANQTRYHKVTGEEPGKDLKAWSYSIQDISDILDISESVVYDLIKKDNIEVILVDNVKRVTKEAFEKWYKGQTRYRTREDKRNDRAVENASISMPDMARLLGIERSEVYRILSGKEYGHLFEVFTLADRKRITKKSFEDFLDIQNEYKLINTKYYKSIRKKNYKSRKKKKVKDRISNLIGDREYLTVEEASLIANMSRSSISRYYRERVFTALKIGPNVRIQRDSFEKWITEKEKKEKGK